MNSIFRIFLIVSMILQQTSLNAKEFVSIEIVTEPDFADVFVDGRFLGISPLKIDKLKVGKHSIELIHPLAGKLKKDVVIEKQNDASQSLEINMGERELFKAEKNKLPAPLL